MSLYEVAKAATQMGEDFKFGADRGDNIITIDTTYQEDEDGDSDYDKPISIVSLYEGDDGNAVNFEIDPHYSGMNIEISEGFNDRKLKVSIDRKALIMLFSAVRGVVDAQDDKKKLKWMLKMIKRS